MAPNFALTEENCATATDICRRLDGLPLAIELAAVRLASMTPDDLLERLDDRFRLLTAERGQQPPRHTALLTTVEWSHELLDEGGRILWRRLSVFAGSFEIEVAEAVCSGDGLERVHVLDLIGSLVDRSILTMAPGSGRGRYRFLETMRLYGVERLREAGEEAALRRRHADWYVERFSPREHPWWRGAGQAEGLDLLDLEWANVEAALDFLAGSAEEAETGLRLAADLWLYWLVRGRYRLGRRHLEAFLARAPEPTATRAMALWAVGFFAQATGDHEAAFSAFEEARRASAERGMARELGYALSGLGLVRLRLGEVQSALEVLTASRETMLEVDDAMGRCLVIYFLGSAVAGAGRLTDAPRLAEEGVEISESGDMFARGNFNTLLGIVQWQLDDPQTAEETLKEALRTQAGVGHRWGMATTLEGLAWVAASSGRLERAALLLGSGAAQWRELGNALMPYLQPYHDASEGSARTGLGEARFQARWDEGFSLPRRATVAVALEEPLPGDGRAPAADAADAFELTGRELEVARLVAGGLSNPDIASTLFVSRATVKTHVSHILRKLALDSRVQLATWVAAHDPGSAAPTGG